MKKRLIALLLIVALLIPTGIASAATWYRVSTSSLQVRMQPSESSKVLASYRQDSVCTVSSSKDGWSYVSFYNGTQGYVQTKYLKKASSYSAWVASDGTALRSKPDGGAGSIATMAKGTKVTVLSHGSSYDYVKAGAFGTGFIRNSLLSKKKVAASGSESQSNGGGGNYDAWVIIAGFRTVNLYTSASTSSAKIASYPTATKVHVNSKGSKWSNVTVDGNTGWMQNAYLSTAEPAPTATPDPNGGSQQQGDSSYTAYVVSSNRKAVNVRKGNSKNYTVLFKVPYGAPVTVLKHDKKWDKIRYNGREGYIENSFLQTSKPADAGNYSTDDPNVTATPKPAFSQYTATVTINDLNFHKKKGDWSSNVDGVGRLQSGYEVTVLKIEGGWAEVSYNGKTGWVHKEYISP